MAGAGGAAPFGSIKCTPTGTGDGKHDLVGGEGGPAPAEWTLKAGVTAGTVTPMASFTSMAYSTDKYQAKVLHFPYWIYTSANYVKGNPAIVLLMGDGNQFLTQFHFPTVLDNLTAAGELPPTVAIFIDPPSDGMRVLTYDPPTDSYTKFLFDEFLPQIIYDKYSVSRDPNAWAEVGYSASGGQGWKVLWNRPNDIHKFVGFNSSFGAATTYMVNWVNVVNMDPARPYLRVSLLTSVKDIGAPQGDADPRGDWQAINTNMATAIGAKGGQWRLMNGMGHHYEPVDGEHDLPNALRWTFQGCKF
jgi:enterochelin esterase family protein